MNREFTPASTMSRTVFAVAAIVTTALIVGAIDSLAGHYSGSQWAALATATTFA